MYIDHIIQILVILSWQRYGDNSFAIQFNLLVSDKSFVYNSGIELTRAPLELFFKILFLLLIIREEIFDIHDNKKDQHMICNDIFLTNNALNDPHSQTQRNLHFQKFYKIGNGY